MRVRHPLKKYPLTLLEILIAFVLLAICSSVIGTRMHQAISRKKFQTEIAKFKEELRVVQKLAIAMQSDWKGILKREKRGWTFLAKCSQPNVQEMKKIEFNASRVILNGKDVREVEIDFFSTGWVYPEGAFIFFQGPQMASVSIL